MIADCLKRVLSSFCILPGQPRNGKAGPLHNRELTGPHYPIEHLPERGEAVCFVRCVSALPAPVARCPSSEWAIVRGQCRRTPRLGRISCDISPLLSLGF